MNSTTISVIKPFVDWRITCTPLCMWHLIIWIKCTWIFIGIQYVFTEVNINDRQFWLSWFLSMFVSHLWKYICEYLAYHKLLWIQVIVSADIFPIWAFLHMLPIFYVLNCLGNVNVCIADLVQDWSNISALAMELLQACTKPSVYFHFTLSPTQEHHMLKFILKEDKKTSTACS